MVSAFSAARLTSAPVATARPPGAGGDTLGDSLLRESGEYTLRELSERARVEGEAAGAAEPGPGDPAPEDGPFGADEFYAETKLRELTALLQDIRAQHNSAQELMRERIESQDRAIEALTRDLGESRAEVAGLRREFAESEKRSSSIISRLQTSMQTVIEATSHISVRGGAAVDLSALADLQRQRAPAGGGGGGEDQVSAGVGATEL